MSKTKKVTAALPTELVEREATGPLSSYRDFDAAVMDIHRNITDHDDPSLEVTEELFGALTKGQKTNYLTYGSPGIKVFLAGTRAQIEIDEALPAEKTRDLEIKRISTEANK